MSRTLKDIARLAGVSKVTVHKAIYGKPGVSEKTRERVMEIVRGVGYAVNPAASSLKREELRIAVITPWLEPRLNYFHRIIAKGIDAAEAELAVYRVAVDRHFCDATWQSQAAILENILASGGADGVVIYCNDNAKLDGYFDRLREKGVPVVTFHGDAPNSCRIACVTAPDERSGRLAAEMMNGLVGEGGHILVLGGNKALTVLRDNVAGFFGYLRDHRPDLTALEINDFETIDRLMDEFRRLCGALGDVRGVYCNSARNCPPLCETVIGMGLAGRVKVITNDVFAELRPYFEQGVVTATMWQDPKNQARNAIHLMYRHLTARDIPDGLCAVRIGVVLNSNFEDYCE